MLFSTVCYFSLITVALAFNVSIYKSADYNIQNVTHPAQPVHTAEKTYKFEFNMNEKSIVEIRLKNKPPDVDARVYVTQPTKYHSGDIENKTMKKCNYEDCSNIRLQESIKSRKSESKSISIGIQLEKGHVGCATQIILEGNATLPDAKKKDTDRSLCLNEQRCTVVMDVLNVCQENNYQQPSQPAPPAPSSSQTDILIYVIPSVIVMCVIILAIYLSVKKFRRRNSDPRPKNEVLYADLSFVNGNSQPPRHEEESPYAEIIGVLKPK